MSPDERKPPARLDGPQIEIFQAGRMFSSRSLTFPLADWLLRDVGIDPTRRKFPGRQGEAEPVTKREWEAVLRKVGDSQDKVRPEIEKLMRRQRRYADAAGDFFYLVRAACNF